MWYFLAANQLSGLKDCLYHIIKWWYSRTRWIDGIAGEISSVAAMELNKYNKTLQAKWGTAEEVVVQASHLVIEQAQNHPLTVSQKNNPKIS
jgi:hypothetical protein